VATLEHHNPPSRGMQAGHAELSGAHPNKAVPKQGRSQKAGLVLAGSCVTFLSRSPRRRRASALGPQLAAAKEQVIGYRSLLLPVGTARVPVSFWYPTAQSGGSAGSRQRREETPYRHFISVGKIVEVLQGSEVPRSVGWEYKLRSGEDIAIRQNAPVASASVAATTLQERRKAAGLGAQQCAVIFAHGYLGSRFDMLHLCELLASQGFVVAAPDFAEGLSGSVPADPEQVNRGKILSATIRRLQKEFEAEQFGIVGHSAGGGTATMATGGFSCGRVAVAGLAPGYQGPDPLLVVASAGDGVIPLSRVVQAVPKGAASFERGEDVDVTETAAALLMRQGRGEPLPCHISFLSSEANNAMISLLSPLLPVARALEVPVLDFDKYLALQDADSVAAEVLPVIERFFIHHATKQ